MRKEGKKVEKRKEKKEKKVPGTIKELEHNGINEDVNRWQKIVENTKTFAEKYKWKKTGRK